MTKDYMKALLATCYRHELVDLTFGDAEVHWSRNARDIEPMVAEGYFGRDAAEVVLLDVHGEEMFRVDGADAREMEQVGLAGMYERNDDG